MTNDEFWNHIRSAHDESMGDMDTKSEIIRNRVSTLESNEAVMFSRHFDRYMDESYTWGLWAAAYIAHGGCSDDTFIDFRASLISRGRLVFEAALENPDSLASEVFDEEAWFYEGYQYAISDGVEASAGELPARASSSPADPAGEPWDEDDEEYLEKHYPALWARHQIVTDPPEIATKPWWKFW